MEDIEDMAKSAHAGFPLREVCSSVAFSSRKILKNQPSPAVPESFEPPSVKSSANGVPGVETIYVKTFGCSHNQSDSEYMAGQLSEYGYYLTEEPNQANLWLINTCTVKNPSQSAMETLIRKGKELRKPLVVAGCVPQGNSKLEDLDGVSIVGVQQIDHIVEVVEETLKGHEVRLLRRRSLPSLDLPKVRKNKFVEIVPINVGCLGACTYCKTKHARGHLGSYTISALVDRVRSVIADGVTEIWLSSEDTGAYGRDLGADLPTLLRALVAELPADRSIMLRIGMTNPPYILQHLESIAEILNHPCIYSFLHVPVQSGSDAVLNAMKREYTVAEFRQVADTIIRLVPNVHFATDIICGFPGETVEDFGQTVSLIKDYKFAEVHISQFYPRPGTPAARMKKVQTAEVKRRSRELTSVFESFSPYKDMEGHIQRVWVTDIASDGIHLVGHTKSYVQVLLPASSVSLGSNCEVKIMSVGRWSVMGEPLCPSPNVPVSEDGQLEYWKKKMSRLGLGDIVTAVADPLKGSGSCACDGFLDNHDHDGSFAKSSQLCTCDASLEKLSQASNCDSGLDKHDDYGARDQGCGEHTSTQYLQDSTEANSEQTGSGNFDASLQESSSSGPTDDSSISRMSFGMSSRVGRWQSRNPRHRKGLRSQRGRRIGINYGDDYGFVSTDSEMQEGRISKSKCKGSLPLDLVERGSWVDRILTAGIFLSLVGIFAGIGGLLHQRIIQ